MKSAILFDFLLDNLSNRRVFIDGPTPAVGHQLVVLYDVHITLVVVLVECVEAPFVTDEPARAFLFVAATVVLLAVKVPTDAVDVAFLGIGNQVGPSPAALDRLIPSFGVFCIR